MQVLYQRCAAVDVGKDVIAVAVRLPGDGPDGRRTVKRTFKAFYGVLAEAARWMGGLGVTHVAMEATGIYSMPVYHALLEHGNFEKVLACNARACQERAGPQDGPVNRTTGRYRRSED
jgi:transposase